MSSIVDRMIKSIDVDVGRFLQEIEDNVRESRKVFHQWDTAQCIISPQEWDDIQLKVNIVQCLFHKLSLHLFFITLLTSPLYLSYHQD